MKQWSAHIASAADAAVQAAEASSGVEGAHEAALARAQAVVMATDGFTAQVRTFFADSDAFVCGCHACHKQQIPWWAVMLLEQS